jgi:hypothetical protein
VILRSKKWASAWAGFQPAPFFDLGLEIWIESMGTTQVAQASACGIWTTSDKNPQAEARATKSRAAAGELPVTLCK